MNTPHNETDTERSNTMFSTGTALNDIAFRIVALIILAATASLLASIAHFGAALVSTPGAVPAVIFGMAVLAGSFTCAVVLNRRFEAAKLTVASDEAVFAARMAAYSLPAIEVFPTPAYASVKADRELVTVGA